MIISQCFRYDLFRAEAVVCVCEVNYIDLCPNGANVPLNSADVRVHGADVHVHGADDVHVHVHGVDVHVHDADVQGSVAY